jgi:hypothetical protein
MRWRQSFRQGEDDVEVLGIEEFSLTILDPLSARQARALCAIPISARVVTSAFVGALIAMFPVTAESGSPAQFDGTHDPVLRRRQRSGMLFPTGCAIATQHVGDFQLGTIHGPVPRSTAPTESSCLNGPAMPGQPTSQSLPDTSARRFSPRSHPANGSVDPMDPFKSHRH